MTDTDPFIALAVISGAHGIKGAVKLRPFSPQNEQLLSYPLQREDGTKLKLKRIGEAKGQLICSLEGLTDRNEAEKLKGTVLGVPRSALPDPKAEDGEFYIEDLIGMNVHLENGEYVGQIKAVHNFGAGDIIEISTQAGDELFSFDEATFPHVDPDNRRLTLHPPEILSDQKQ